MLKIGITGQEGFVGTNLFNTIALFNKEFKIVAYSISFFEDQHLLDQFVGQCDVIVHLAALNRHPDPQALYETNIGLVNMLVGSLKRTNSKAHVLLSSSSQEEFNNLYGKSKRDGRELLIAWAESVGAPFTGLIIPNVYGPFGKPHYNSVIATFSHQLVTGETPKIHVDCELNLIYIGELAIEILNKIRERTTNIAYLVPHTTTAKVSRILSILQYYKNCYQDRGEIPKLDTSFEINLFNTFRSYIDIATYYPVKYIQHIDPRGSFVELIRLGIGGQVSFSTTIPGITRGNHFHTRKIERFSVIKGKALIQLRRIGTNKVLDFYLDGDEPAYVDMPIWHTHCITNIGLDVLYTSFWINEFYDINDPDTYFEEVSVC